MYGLKVKLSLIVAFAALTLLVRAGVRWQAARSPARAAASVGLPDAQANEQAIRFFAARVRRAPDDHVAQNKLAACYLQRVRETGSPDDLALAFRATHASLASVPSVRNVGGLTALTLAEQASHAFAQARDHARELSKLEPDRPTPYRLLGDALLELGEYDKAAAAFQKMAALSRVGGVEGIETETRFARLALLRGDTATAERRLKTALVFARGLVPPPRETVAWCHWQLGETVFSVGDYPRAEAHYRDALATFPDHAPSLASLGRVRAARGDGNDAIAWYEQAVRRLPDDIAFVAALGDLYHLAGREKDAQGQYARVEEIGRAEPGAIFDRPLALFYADHDLHAAEAYQNAARVYKERPDIVGADILAWTAFKAGKIPAAQKAMKAALRLGTRDARFFYHASQIARAAGDEKTARNYLNRALALSPRFDPLQAAAARRASESSATTAATGPTAGNIRSL